MAAIELSCSVLKSKFRGCITGALVGDCIGDRLARLAMLFFELEDFEWKKGDSLENLRPSKQRLKQFMTNVMSEESTEETKELHYTDDTAMTINVASSLVEKGMLDVKDMAEKFVYDYFHQMHSRGYGAHVRHVFHRLEVLEFKDVFSPAKELFDGQGSFGNGAAMRISPIALFGNNKGEEYMVNAAKKCSLITHSHPDGYRGAILQCLAVSAALKLDPSQECDPVKFIKNLLDKMQQIEIEKTKPYCNSLEKMKEIFVQNQGHVTSKEIAKSLGNGDDASALKSVPTAIFSFLRGMKPLNKTTLQFLPAAVYTFLTNSEKHFFKSQNPFMRTIYIAISVGGDTDTIGSMAGAIAGAYYGEDMIPDIVKKRCEGFDDVIVLADKLFDVASKHRVVDFFDFFHKKRFI